MVLFTHGTERMFDNIFPCLFFLFNLSSIAVLFGRVMVVKVVGGSLIVPKTRRRRRRNYPFVSDDAVVLRRRGLI